MLSRVRSEMQIPALVFDGSWPFHGGQNHVDGGELRADYNVYLNAEPPLLHNWKADTTTWTRIRCTSTQQTVITD